MNILSGILVKKGFFMKKVILIFLTLVGSISFISAETLWEDTNIRLNDGTYIWARLDKDSCYGISVGSVYSDIHGIASNCGNSINGTWSVRANGNKETWVHGGVEDVIKEIINNR